MNNTIVELSRNEIKANDSLQGMYSQWISYIDVTEQTRKTYEKALKQFFLYLGNNGISNPTRQDILDYKAHLLETRKATTTQMYIIALRQFFDFCEINGLYENIAKNIKGAKVQKGFKKDYLTKAQIKDLLANTNTDTTEGARDYAILCLMLTTGIRTIEVVRAKTEDIKPLGNDIVLYLQGKGRQDKTECVKVAPVVLEAIKKYRTMLEADSEYLFVSLSNKNKGGQLTTRSISRIVSKYLQLANLKSDRLTAHSMRHTAITQMLLNGATLEEARQVARHSNINTTLIYNHAIERANNNSEIALAEAIL